MLVHVETIIYKYIYIYVYFNISNILQPASAIPHQDHRIILAERLIKTYGLGMLVEVAC